MEGKKPEAEEQLPPSAETVQKMLDSIPGAFEAASEGLNEAKAGRTVQLSDL